MQFIKDFGKLFVVIIGLAILLAGISFLMGGTSNPNSIEYHLYEHEMAEDEFVNQER